MSCRMLFFDYRESEESFFDRNSFANFDIKFFTESLNEKILEKLTEEDFEKTMIISVFIHSVVNDEIIKRFKNLRVVSTRSTGYDHIDISSCVGKNIAIVNVASYGDVSVAQFTFTVMLALVRNLSKALHAQQKYFSNVKNLTGRNLTAMTLGIVGTGDIGSSVCKLAHAFGMNILAYDIAPNHELIEICGAKYVELNDLLQGSNIVTLHLPYTKENYHMFGEKEFDMMKDNSYFINVSRGELVNNEALLKFARMSKFEGIALDVVACPQNNNNQKDKSSVDCVETSDIIRELADLDNVILTPHMAYDTQESVDLILEETFKGLTDCLMGGKGYRIV